MPRFALSMAAFFLVVFPLRADEAADRDFFESRIRPVLVQHCYRCHSEDAKSKGKLKAELLVDTRAGLLKGGSSGRALAAGKPGESLLLKAMTHDGDIQMPPSGKLPANVLADFKIWIERGAYDPRDGKTQTAGEIDWTTARSFWAFVPPTDHPRPNVKNAAWPKRDIDNFLLAELEKRGMSPAPMAGKEELIRRATFDLIGLPPTPEEIDAFVKDQSPEAFAKVVDRLLASPHHGERWGRYWLDVARYAEDKALAFVNTRPHAYRYRDWVIEALNRDMPYDRFLRRQLAGDLIDDPEPDHVVKLGGLGFQGLGQEYHRGSVGAQVMADELDDRIDTLTRGLLGLTVACARCHDHKYDPIPTRDYYSLAAAYNGSNLTLVPMADAKDVAVHAAWEKQSKEAEAKFNQWIKDQTKTAREAHLAEAGRYLETAWRVRQLRRHKLAADPEAIAKQEKLHPMLLERAIAFLEPGNPARQERAKERAIAGWFAIAEKADAHPKDGAIIVPKEISDATAAFTGHVREALKPADGKTPTTLIKALSIDKGAPFLFDDKDAPQYFDEANQKEYSERKTRLSELKKSAPPAPPLTHGIVGGGVPMKINIRGNVNRQGDVAPPGFLKVLGGNGSERFTRRDLAEAIADPKNPLTARVIVNRVWHYHFGRGIVATTSNFGQLGDRPSHPELLDRLAVRFMENGWSLRWLHRELMLSAAYQLSSKADARHIENDPENVFLGRFTARRLDFEAWRDAWLAVSGRLDRTVGGPPLDLNEAKHVRRTLYSKISRLEANKLMILFDFPDANVTSDRRGVTTAPQQQLFVLNSDFAIETAKAFAKRLEAASPDDGDRIALAFRLAFGREATDRERAASLMFVRNAVSGPSDRLSSWDQFAQAILAANEFMWVD